MRVSEAGMRLIKESEGCVLKAYPDPATGGEPWTIGYGHTGSDVRPGKVIDQAEADRLLDEDVDLFERGVNRLVVVDLTQGQFDALVCFAFNLGLGALQQSTLLKLLNARDYEGAAKQFARWNRASGSRNGGADQAQAGGVRTVPDSIEFDRAVTESR